MGAWPHSSLTRWYSWCWNYAFLPYKAPLYSVFYISVFCKDALYLYFVFCCICDLCESFVFDFCKICTVFCTLHCMYFVFCNVCICLPLHRWVRGLFGASRLPRTHFFFSVAKLIFPMMMMMVAIMIMILKILIMMITDMTSEHSIYSDPCPRKYSGWDMTLIWILNIYFMPWSLSLKIKEYLLCLDPYRWKSRNIFYALILIVENQGISSMPWSLSLKIRGKLTEKIPWLVEYWDMSSICLPPTRPSRAPPI